MAATGQSFYELYRRSRYCAITINSNIFQTNFLSSIGIALADTLDELISAQKIEPQLAMRILANFDRSISEVLAEKVKARLSFKVSFTYTQKRRPGDKERKTCVRCDGLI